jgi:hypothetical protein
VQRGLEEGFEALAAGGLPDFERADLGHTVGELLLQGQRGDMDRRARLPAAARYGGSGRAQETGGGAGFSQGFSLGS